MPEAGGRTLAFDTHGDDVVGDHRATRAVALTTRDRLAVLALGGGFIVTSLALVVLLGSNRSPGLAVAAVYLLVYGAVSRVEFEVFTGAAAPTQLVLVPMLFVLPLPTVPVIVACGLVLGSVVDWLAHRASLERASLHLMGSWHAVGPVLVLGLAGDGPLTLSRWPLYAAALAAQFAVEAASICTYEFVARGVRPFAILRHLGRVQLVDAMLAPAGLAFAFAARQDPYAVLLVLPLVAMLRVFAQRASGSHRQRARALRRLSRNGVPAR